MPMTWLDVHQASDAQVLDGVEKIAAKDPTTDWAKDETRWLADQLLNQAMQRRLRVPRDTVGQILSDPRRSRDAVGLCVWCLERDTAMAMVRPLLDHADSCAMAAWALGRLEDIDSADRLLALLDDSREAPVVLVALSRLDTPGVRAGLARRAAKVNEDESYYLARALRLLTKHSPLLWEPDSMKVSRAPLAKMHAYWGGADPLLPPSPKVSWKVCDKARADISVEHGADIFALDDVHPSRASSWPTWDVAWTVGGRELYKVGSNCGTCEVFLGRTGWAPEEAVRFAQAARSRVADVPALTPELLDALEPVIAGCATGYYDLRLCDVRLVAVTGMSQTWYGQRACDENEETKGEVSVFGPGETLYAGLSLAGGVTALTVAPTQPTTVLDSSQVAAYEKAIVAGARPAVLVGAHAADRYVMACEDREDRSVAGFVIDGHHKLAAYDRLGLPARVLLLCDLSPRLSPGCRTRDLATLFDTVLGGTATPVAR